MSEPALTKTTAVATYGGSVVAFFGGLSANEIAAYVGAAVAVLAWVSNLAVTIYFKRQHLKIAEKAAISRPECATCPDRNNE